MLTALDQVANQNHLQLLKAAIPYIQPSSQKMASVCIKVLELQNVLRFYKQNDRCMGACSTSSDPPGIVDILTDIRNYCEDGEQEMVDQCIQVISTMELYSMFMQSQDEPTAEL